MTERHRTPRVAVYAPMLNEAKNVVAWAKMAEEADVLVLADTGSTDASLRIARDYVPPSYRQVSIVHEIGVLPFRFDRARNAALALVPRDVDFCLAVDLDERLQPGWRAAIDRVWRAGANQVTFMFEWGPGVKFRYDRMHARAGFVWKGAAHEFAAGPGPRMDSDVVVVHERDQDKDRSQYFPLLEMSHKEDPTDPRYAYYLAREYMYRGEYGPARDLFAGYLKLPTATFDQERSEACRFIAKMVWPRDRERWLLRAAYESPTRRECWADLATHYAESNMPREAAGAAARALSITAQDGTNSFHLEAAAWDNATFEAMLDIPVPVG